MTAMIPVDVMKISESDNAFRKFGAGTGRFMFSPVLGVTSETYTIGETPIPADIRGSCRGCGAIPAKKIGSGLDKSMADTMSRAAAAALEMFAEGGVMPSCSPARENQVRSTPNPYDFTASGVGVAGKTIVLSEFDRRGVVQEGLRTTEFVRAEPLGMGVYKLHNQL